MVDLQFKKDDEAWVSYDSVIDVLNSSLRISGYKSQSIMALLVKVKNQKKN